MDQKTKYTVSNLLVYLLHIWTTGRGSPAQKFLEDF